MWNCYFFFRRRQWPMIFQHNILLNRKGKLSLSLSVIFNVFYYFWRQWLRDVKIAQTWHSTLEFNAWTLFSFCTQCTKKEWRRCRPSLCFGHEISKFLTWYLKFLIHKYFRTRIFCALLDIRFYTFFHTSTVIFCHVCPPKRGRQKPWKGLFNELCTTKATTRTTPSRKNNFILLYGKVVLR